MSFRASRKGEPVATPVQVQIVDRRPIVRAGLAALVRSVPDFELAGESESVHLPVVADVVLIEPELVPAAWRQAGSEGASTPRRVVLVGTPVPPALVAALRRHRNCEVLPLAASAELLVERVSARRRPLALHRRRAPSGPLVRLPAHGAPERAPRPKMRSCEGPCPYGLSKREREVLRLVAAGAAPADIGLALDLASSTVSTFLRRLKDKLQLGTLVELAAFAELADLATPSPEAAHREISTKRP